MGVMLTEVQLKKLMPKLCKLLNAEALFVSLSGELGDVDEEIVRKKMEKSCTEGDGMIILYMYKALKKTLGDDHVDCFLRAVQEQFEDLGKLGIKIEAPESKEKVARLPRHEQPDATRAATGSRPCQPRSAESRERDPATQHQHESLNMFPDSPGHRHQDPSSLVVAGTPRSMNSDPLSCKSTFTTSDFYSIESQRNFQSAGWGSGVQREIREADTVLPPMSRCSVPCADRDRPRQYHEQSGISMNDLISGMNVADSLQRHAQERAAHSSEPTTERRAPYPSTSDGSVRSGNSSVTEVAEANNVGNAARIPLNNLTSVEDNTAHGIASADEVEGGEGSSPLAANPSDLTNRPDRKIGNLPGPTPDAFNHGNVQTDGELPTHDLQPEQPEDLVENSEDDQWASDAPQSTTSPMRVVEETARLGTVINIGKIIVQGEGNNVVLGGNTTTKTVHNPPRQQKEYTPHRGREEECPALPQAVSTSIVDQSEDTTAKLPITYLDPNDPRHCQQIAQFVESQCLPDLSIFRSSDSHHNTKPKVAAQNQAEKGVITSNFNESDESSKPSQIQDQEIGTGQNPNQPTCGFSKPGILLGPLELQMLEEQRNASIEIPSGVVLSPEASRSW